MGPTREIGMIYTPHDFAELDVEDQHQADELQYEINALKRLEQTLVEADKMAREIREALAIDLDEAACEIVSALDELHDAIHERQTKLDVWEGANEAMHVAEERAAYRASVL